MRKYTFVCQEHEEHGETGWLPKWFQRGDPLGGMGVAHDILEHLHSHDGTVADEMLAFGASMFVRGETGWYSRGGRFNTRWCDNVYGEIAMMLRDHVSEPDRHDWLPREVKRAHRLDNYIEEEFDIAIQRIGKMFLDEDGEREDLNRFFGPQQQDFMRFLWRRGYRKARGVYGDNQYELDTVFTEIARLADHWLKEAYEGQELHVWFSRRTVKFIVEFDEEAGR